MASSKRRRRPAAQARPARKADPARSPRSPRREQGRAPGDAAKGRDSAKGGDSASAPERSGRRRRWLLLAAAGACLLLVLVFARTWVVTVCTQQARAALARQQLPAANEWLQEALAWEPTDADTHFLLARVARKQGDSRRFQQHLTEARRLGADEERCRRERWLAQAQAGQLREVADRFDTLLNDPRGDGAEICEAIANGYMLNGRFADALEILEGWQAAYPGDGHPHYMRGLVARHLGDLTKARAAFLQALERTPQHPAATLALADLQRERNEVEQALHYYRQAADYPSTATEARIGQAACLRRLDQPDEARRLLEELLAENEDLPEAQRQLAELDLAAGRAEQAVSRLRPVLSRHPRDLELKYQLATALSMAGRAEEAAELFDQVVEARRALNHAQEQITQLENQPESPATRVEIGRTLLQYGDPRDGLMWLQSALNVDDSYAPAHQTLADYYERQRGQDPAAGTRARFHRRQAAQER